MHFFEKNFLSLFFAAIVLPAVISMSSCRKETVFDKNVNTNLIFSVDTLRFDTVFTTLASITKRVIVKNPSSDWIKITEIRIQNGAASFFRVNMDGFTSLAVYNIEIAPKDSMFIFVRVTIDPTNKTNPFEIQDKLLFQFNGKEQELCLTAWGQDAYYHLPDKILKIPYIDPANPNKIDTQYIPYSLVDCSTPFPNDKPHIVYGYWVVDSDNTFIVPAGSKIHFAPDASLWVYEGGSIKVKGQKGQPVFFQGMRLEARYADIPGQWGRIWLSAGSKDNEIDYAIIKNGTVGIWADTVVNGNPNLVIKNTIIKNMSAIGLLGQGSKIRGSNLVIGNCQNASLALTLGGSYDFYQSTFTNFWNANTNPTYSLLLNDYYIDADKQIQIRPFEKAEFINCIFYGHNEEQLSIDIKAKNNLPYLFDHCLIRHRGELNNAYINCVMNQDPLFVNSATGNFEITDSLSPAIGRGSPAGASLAPLDINGVYRSGIPTIGAYEYVAAKESVKQKK